MTLQARKGLMAPITDIFYAKITQQLTVLKELFNMSSVTAVTEGAASSVMKAFSYTICISQRWAFPAGHATILTGAFNIHIS